MTSRYKIYRFRYLVSRQGPYETEIDALSAKGITAKFWRWIRTNTLLNCSDVTLWSMEQVYREGEED